MGRVYSNMPLDVSGQISKLKSDGLDIPDIAIAEHELSIISYFRLSEYLRPMRGSDGKRFKMGSSLDNALKLYYFDRELRCLLFRTIQSVEIALRTSLIQIISMSYGSFWFMEKDKFKNTKTYFATLGKITSEIGRSHETYITDFYDDYSSPSLPPVWKTLEVLSFGTLSKMYENLSEKSLKRGIARSFNVPTHVYFENWILTIAILRNMCAHHNRVWNRRFAIKPKIPRSMPSNWIKNINPDPAKLYLQLCILQYLEDSIHPSNKFSEELQVLLGKYPSVDIAAMGFPDTWQEEPLWNKTCQS